MANTHETLADLFSAMANSIRSKINSTNSIVADNFPSAIDGIVTLAEGSADGTAASNTMLNGYTAYVKGQKVTGNIPTKTSSDLSASGATVTVPAGYYASQTTKSVTTTTQATPSITVDSAGKITASSTQSAGYVSAGTKTGTKQLTTKAATTITPSTSEQTAVNSGVYTTGVIKVAAMPTVTQATPSISVDSAGKITASATQSAGYVAAGTKTGTKQLTVQAAQTITPGTSNKTIASGTYLTGTQTIAGDADLVSSNIKKGVSIFGVDGNYDAVELNFTVVGGETQPSNPTENTIWINTSTAINGWYFTNISNPTSTAAEGFVYIVFASSDFSEDASFNAIKSNGIYINPLSVIQYINGAWVQKTTKIYKNGNWIELNEYLFYNGNEYTDITGGWIKSSASTSSNCSVSISVGKLLITASTSQGAIFVCTNNRMDLSPYSAMKVKVDSFTQVLSKYTPAARCQIHNSSTNYDDYKAATVFSSAGEYIVDLSAITTGYPSIVIYNASVTISRIELIR